MSQYTRRGLFSATAVLTVTQYALADNNSSIIAQVPSGYVQVPGGYAVHQSCLHEVPSGTKIDHDRKEISLNGTVIAHVQVPQDRNWHGCPSGRQFHTFFLICRDRHQ